MGSESKKPGCHKCGGKVVCVNSRSGTDDYLTRRRYRCNDCRHAFTTHENVIDDETHPNGGLSHPRLKVLRMKKGILSAIEAEFPNLRFGATTGAKTK